MDESITVEMIAKAVIKMMMTKDATWFWNMASEITPVVESERQLALFFKLLEGREDKELRNVIRGIVIEELPSALNLFFAE